MESIASARRPRRRGRTGGRLTLLRLPLLGWRRPLLGRALRRGRSRRSHGGRNDGGLIGIATRPAEIVGATGRSRRRLAAHEHAGGERVGRGGSARGPAAGEILGRGAGSRQRHDRTGHRPRCRGARLRSGCRLLWLGRRQRHWRGARRHQPLDFAFDVMPELQRAGFGEVHAVYAAELADLAVIVGTAQAEIAVLVDETIPHVHVDDSGLLPSRPVEVVEVGEIGARSLSADRRQAHPDHRNAFALERRNRVVDALGVKLAPFFRTEFVCGGGRRPRLRCGLLRLDGAFAVLRLILLLGLLTLLARLALRLLLALLRRLILLALLRRPARRRTLADRLTIGEPDHHDDEIRLLGTQEFASGLYPIIGV